MKIELTIDHTTLKADAKKETIIRYSKEAKEHQFASVCANSCFVPGEARTMLAFGVDRIGTGNGAALL